MKGLTKRTLLAAALLLLGGSASATAKLHDKCVVSLLNRTARVRADGSWVLTNVPAGAAKVRARATCIEKNGTTRTGQSDYFSVPVNGVIEGINIRFEEPTPDPAVLQMSASTTVLAIGDATQIVATATFPNGSTRDVTTEVAGTSYTTSNPAIATVSENGFVTAVGSGAVIIGGMNEGALALLRLTVGGAADRDGDGMPDEFELQNGLDPLNPADGALDADADGLSNADEYRNGTGLRDADSDDDGVRDGLEVQTGSDPLNPASVNLDRALRRITVQPPSVMLRVNPLFGEASQQLTVTGTLLDGVTLDLTATARGTTYSSTDLTVCGFAETAGVVVAGNTGECTVTVANSGFTVPVPARVDAYQPRGLTSIPIPGYANNVKVKNGFAYVAAGSAGLQIVDVRNPSEPAIAGILTLDGIAIDLRIKDDLIFVACGEAGVRAIDISNPLAPRQIGSIDTPGIAQDIWLDGLFAYVADEDSGLQIISIADPSAMSLVSSLAVGTARGVSVEQGVAAVATDSAVAVVNVTNPQAAQQVGSVTLSGAKDVVIRGGFAYVAAYDSGLQIIDVRTPATPVITGALPESFVPRDVVLTDQFAVMAEQLFPNAIPFADIRVPSAPIFRGIIDLSALGDYAGTGIDIDQRYVFVTEEVYFVGQEYGSLGDTRLFIAEYQTYNDTAGMPPVVRLASPVAGASLIRGSREVARVEATDDVAVSAVSLLVDGQSVATSEGSTASLPFRVPTTGTEVTLTGRAVDFGGNSSATAGLTLPTIADPLTTVIGFVKNAQGEAVAGATVTLASGSPETLLGTAMTTFDGSYRFESVPTVDGAYGVSATAQIDGNPASGSFGGIVPVRGGITSVPNITIAATIWIATPARGAAIVGGDTIQVEVRVGSTISVDAVTFLLNGSEVYWVYSPPFVANIRIEAGAPTATLGAFGYQWEGLGFHAPDVVVNVVADPLTIVTGRVLDLEGQAVGGATVTAGGITSFTDGSGAYQLPGVPTVGLLNVHAQVTIGGRTLRGGVEAAPIRGGVTPVPNIVVRESPCGEAECMPNEGMYVSHFSGIDCAGTESYYLPYDNFRFRCRSWDGEGVCGTLSRTETNRSARISGGPCQNLWPDGNTLSSFVTIYRFESAPEPEPITTARGRVVDSNGQPVSNATVTSGALSGLTAELGDYQLGGLSVHEPVVVAARVVIGTETFQGASPPIAPVPNGITPIPDIVVTITPCGENQCVPSQGTYVSHFTELNCGGTESYYLPYDSFAFACRTWDGGGICGTVRRTETNRSVRVQNGPCQNSWPNGNTLSEFVTIYRQAGDL